MVRTRLSATMLSRSALRVLGIPELAEYVVECAYRSKPQSVIITDPVTLVSIARVNRFLSSIALAKLWKSLVDPSPLFNLLPAKVLNAAMGEQEMPASCAIECVERFIFYSTLIHTINLSKSSQSIRIFSFMAGITKQMGLHHIQLPNMRVLHLRLSNTGAVPKYSFEDWAYFLNVLGTDAMTDLRANVYYAPHLLEVQRYGSKCPNLKNFVIENCISGSMIISQPLLLDPALVIWKALNVLDVMVAPKVLYNLLEYVASFRRLGYLIISVQLELEHHLTLEPKRDRATRQRPLKVEHMVFKSYFVADFISACSISSKLMISYNSIHCYVEAPFGVLASSLSKYCPGVSSFYLYRYQRAGSFPITIYSNSTSIQENTITASLLESFSQLAKLTTINLSHVTCMQVTVAVLRTFANSCPNLEYCCFNPSIRVPTQEITNLQWYISLSDVVSFASQCLRLKVLAILFDARKPTDDNVTITSSSSTNLISLHVGESAINDVQYAYSGIARGFPSLRSLNLGRLDGQARAPPVLLMSKEENQAWNEVKALLFPGRSV